MRKDTRLSPRTHVHIPENPGNEARKLVLSGNTKYLGRSGGILPQENLERVHLYVELLRIARFCIAKGRHDPKFSGENFRE